MSLLSLKVKSQKSRYKCVAPAREGNKGGLSPALGYIGRRRLAVRRPSGGEPEPSTRQSSVVTQIFQAMNLKQPLLLETTKPSIKKFLLEFKRYRLKYKTQMKEDDVIQDCVDPSSLENMTFMLGIDVSILLNQSRGFS